MYSFFYTFVLYNIVIQQLVMVKRTTTESVLREEMSQMWEILESSEKKLLLENFQVQTFKKNGLIYCEGDTPTHLMCLLKGKVKIYKDGIGGRPQIIRLIRPVQYFGYRAFFAGESYGTSACAFEAATIGLVPMDLIERLIKQNNQFAYFFIKELSVGLGKSDTRTVNLTQKHIRGRLAESLLHLKESYGLEEDNATINIYMSRDDLASLSNMTTSNAIRTLSSFCNEKLIIVDGRKIKIINEEQLKKISRFG